MWNFLWGRNGAFDLFISSVILRIKREYYDKNSALVLVLPYLTAEFQNNEKEHHDYYDEIEICEKASEAHYRAAIQIRNREMVDRADLVICFIERRQGGAYEAVRYAENNGKKTVNLRDGFSM